MKNVIAIIILLVLAGCVHVRARKEVDGVAYEIEYKRFGSQKLGRVEIDLVTWQIVIEGQESKYPTITMTPAGWVFNEAGGGE